MEVILRVRNEGKEISTTINDIRINKKLSDLIDIEVRYNNFTWEFEVIGDKDINEFMNYSYNINSNYTLNPNKALDANVDIDNAGSLIDGSLRLLKTNSIENGNIIYTFQLTGYIRDLFSIMDDHILSSLDLSEYNHQRTADHIKENIEGRFTKNGVTITDLNQDDREGYVYANIIYNSLDDVDSRMYVNNMFPAIYFKTLISKIEEKLNIDLGDFLKSDQFNNVIIPYAADSVKKSEEQMNEQTTRVGVTLPSGEGHPSTTVYDLTGWHTHGSSWFKNMFNYRIGQALNGLRLDEDSDNVINNGVDFQFQDPLGSWTQTYDIYQCQKAAYYDIDFIGKLQLELKRAFNNTIEFKGGGVLEYFYELKINGQVVDHSYNALTGGSTLFLSPPGGDHASPWLVDDDLVFNLSQRNVFMEKNDLVNIGYGFRFSGATNWQGNNQEMSARLLLNRSRVSGSNVQYTTLVVKPSDNNTYGGEEFDLASILPADLTITDLFTDLIRMFNLVVIPKPPKNGVRRFDVIPENNYFDRDSDTLLDLNNHIDQYSDLEILPMNETNFKQYILKLQDDDDLYNKDYKSTTQDTYGQSRLNLTNDFTNEKKIIKPENLATSIISDEYSPDRPSLYFLKEDLTKFKPKIRLLNTKSLYSPNYQIWRAPDSGYRLNTLTYIYAGTWDDPYDPSFDMNFLTPDKVYHTTTKIPQDNLYSRYWEKKILNIINPESKRILISEAYMSYEDYISFDFRNVYEMSGIKVRIISLSNYNPTTERLSIEGYTLKEDLQFVRDQRILDSTIPTKLKEYNPTIVADGLTNESLFNRDYTIPERLNKLRKDLNSTLTTSMLNGQRSIVKKQSTNVVNNGNKVAVMNTVDNAIVSDNHKTINQDGLYVSNFKLTDGQKSLKWNSEYIINGNDNVWKINDTDILNGGQDSVRNKGGIRHDRIIMNGNTYGNSIFGLSSIGI